MPAPTSPGPATLSRNWSELLQELRVTRTRVQVLTGFLLTVPFSARFPALDQHQRTACLARRLPLVFDLVAATSAEKQDGPAAGQGRSVGPGRPG